MGVGVGVGVGMDIEVNMGIGRVVGEEGQEKKKGESVQPLLRMDSEGYCSHSVCVLV